MLKKLNRYYNSNTRYSKLISNHQIKAIGYVKINENNDINDIFKTKLNKKTFLYDEDTELLIKDFPLSDEIFNYNIKDCNNEKIIHADTLSANTPKVSLSNLAYDRGYKLELNVKNGVKHTYNFLYVRNLRELKFNSHKPTLHTKSVKILNGVHKIDYKWKDFVIKLNNELLTPNKDYVVNDGVVTVLKNVSSKEIVSFLYTESPHHKIKSKKNGEIYLDTSMVECENNGKDKFLIPMKIPDIMSVGIKIESNKEDIEHEFYDNKVLLTNLKKNIKYILRVKVYKRIECGNLVFTDEQSSTKIKIIN